ncbi:MAG: ABC transporter substrate-binding protein [Firmicutes bacterium]|nr:ABC transporter substrate-binding protein [Bacillota bacterium]MDD3297631.1 ABC transporter substrate-binding protein [Bacillota bacterium]MDD3850860.1 ABC transporter substrate-binding protein [Bacillota bacterium]MDD4707482.1 ABC transporter substrate-binding protein [Bacillota bacterium]
MKTKVNRFITALLVMAMFFALTGCSGTPADDTNEPGTQGASTGEEIVSSKDTMTVAIDREPQSMDPTATNISITCTIVSQIFDTLLDFDPDMNIIPSLAESYEQIDDVTYKFNLRKGVKFHNGEELKASDVVFSLKRANEKPVSRAYTQEIDMEGFETPDDYTVIIRTKEPYAAFYQSLCVSRLSIVNEKATLEAENDVNSNPVGTGPFKFASWTAGDNVTIERNDDYWGETAKLKQVVFRIITEQSSRVVEIESGGVDAALVLPAVDYERLEDNEDIDLELYTSHYVRYIAFNTTQDSLADKRVRQALNYATDIDTIRDVLYTEKGAQKATTPVPPGIEGRHEDLAQYDYNPEKAKELLKEAGYDNDLEISFTYLGNTTNTLMGEMLQEQWKDVGVILTLNPLESGALTENANNMRQEVMPVRSAYSIGEAGEGLMKLFHSSNHGPGGSRVNYTNPRVDELLETAKVTMDENERNEMYREVQEIVHDEALMIYLCYEYTSVALGSKVRGFNPIPTERIDYSTIYFVE